MWKRGEIAPKEQFLLFSTLFYVYISNFRGQITYSFVKCGCSVYWVCVEVLRPSQPKGVMSSAVSLPNYTFTGQALSSKRLTSIVHILSPETDNCPSWISGRERLTVENSSWSISTKECCRPRRGLNPRPPGLQSDGASKWATEAGSVYCFPHSQLWYVAVWISRSVSVSPLEFEIMRVDWIFG